ncbi:ABC transporter substrate-binding protein [Paenibacillus stellifer]|uniref:ABC transporter substrate-binding protein n=1 Tax=Paenibacillus stellifer TaxID=169760 RepID=A0A089LW57_9BACL|nr:sugar ABC transporter substrate-binding protein [Paenibacillus stellifer]AIQ65771.1 ABC transporter substrate-binding protein [Paenibacillus stellifer]
MSTKRKALLLSLVLSVAAILGACSKQTEQGAAESAASSSPAAGGGTLTIMAETSSHADAFKSIIPDFEAKYGVKVKVVELPYDQYHQQLTLKFTSGSADFDLAYVPIGWVPELQVPNYIVPISTDQAELDKLKLDDFPGIGNAYFGDKKELYFVPYMNETQGILYRTDLFNDEKEKAAFKAKYGYDLAPPKTMQQYKEIAEFFNRPDQNLSGVTLMGEKSILLGFAFYNRLFNYGGDLYDDQYKQQFDNEAGVKALNDLKDLFQYTSAAAKQYGWSDASGEFLQGRSAMAEMATTIAQVAQDPAQSKVVGKVGFSAIPANDENTKDIKRFYLPYGFVMTKDSKLKQEALEWIEFATSQEMMEKAAPVGNIPARTSALTGTLSSEYSFYAPHAEIMNSFKLKPLPLIPEGATITGDILPSAVSRFLNGEQTAQEALDQAASEYDELMSSRGY